MATILIILVISVFLFVVLLQTNDFITYARPIVVCVTSPCPGDNVPFALLINDNITATVNSSVFNKKCATDGECIPDFIDLMSNKSIIISKLNNGSIVISQTPFDILSENFKTNDCLLNVCRIDHFAINVRDLNQSASFYKKVFGFGLIHKWNTTWMVGAGEMRVGLFLRPNATDVEDSDNKILISHVAFSTNESNFSSFLKHLDDLKISHRQPEDTGIAKSIFFNDPDGHELEVTYYYDAIPTG